MRQSAKKPLLSGDEIRRVRVSSSAPANLYDLPNYRHNRSSIDGVTKIQDAIVRVIAHSAHYGMILQPN